MNDLTRRAETDESGRRTGLPHPVRRSLCRITLLLSGLILLQASGLAPVHAQNSKITRNVGVLPTHEGPWVTDQDLAKMMDRFFEDGSRGNGTVDSNIVIFATQCYGGNFVENFDDKGGFYYDSVEFSDATIAAASDPERVAYYGGYHLGATATLEPGATVEQVHIAGILSKNQKEAPFHGGDLSKVIGGRTSTHLLVWAESPNALDRQDISKVVGNMQGAPGLTVHVLAGDGSTSQGTSAVTGPATKAALEQALQEIGALMDDGADIDDEQFVMFITDHGSRFTDLTDFVVVPPSTSPPGATVETSIPMEVANDMLSDDQNQVEMVAVPTDPLTVNEEALIGVDVDGQFLGTLANADRMFEISTILGDTNAYAFTVSEATLFGSVDKLEADAEYTIGITNFGSAAIEIGYAGFMTGAIEKPEGDVESADCEDPGALCLQNDRFAATVDWRAFDGSSGTADVVPFGSDDSGLLWFFSADNWEMLIKVIDGCDFNDHYWVFAAATTNVEYELTVTDTETGLTNRYSNPLGRRADAITDTSAFATCPGNSSPPGPDRGRTSAPLIPLVVESPRVVLRADQATNRSMPVPLTLGVSALLYDQTDRAAATASSSQRFDAPLEAFDSQVADDFTLGPGFWRLDRFDVVGVGEGPGVLDLYLYEDHSGAPGPEVYRALGLRPDAGLESADVQLNLPSPPTLPGGTYWLSVQARLDDAADQWAWRNRRQQSGAPAQFRNPPDGFGTGCVDWTARATCAGGNAPDQLFAVHGEEVQLEGCVQDASTLCLNDDRFSIEVRWTDFAGKTGPAQRVPFGSDDSGLLWFFNGDNWEMLVKVLDACGVNDRFWVFAAATTNVEYTLTVTDTQTGATRSYGNELGRASPAIADTDAFAICP